MILGSRLTFGDRQQVEGSVWLSLIPYAVLAGAYATHPERFVKGPALPRPVPTEVWINPPLKEVPQA